MYLLKFSLAAVAVAATGGECRLLSYNNPIPNTPIAVPVDCSDSSATSVDAEPAGVPSGAPTGFPSGFLSGRPPLSGSFSRHPYPHPSRSNFPRPSNFPSGFKFNSGFPDPSGFPSGRPHPSGSCPPRPSTSASTST